MVINLSVPPFDHIGCAVGGPAAEDISRLGVSVFVFVVHHSPEVLSDPMPVTSGPACGVTVVMTSRVLGTSRE